MATFRLPHLSAPTVLRAIDRDRLLRFLGPYRPYLAARGAALPPPDHPAPVPYDDLVAVFMAPDADTPRDLVDALFYVDGMATPEGMDALLAAAADALGPGGGADLTPADVAVQVWLAAPARLERAHAEQHLDHRRSFEHFHTDPAAPPPAHSPGPVADLEAELNDWFEARRRGRTARVFAFPRPGRTWFQVRHGEPFKREETVAAGAEPGSVAYRPLRYDVVAFDPAAGELRVNAQLRGEKDLYRAAFGRHLYGYPGAFPGSDLYTLDPLRTDGPAALACADVPELEWVTLREVQLYVPGAPWELVTHKSDDVFGLFAARDAAFPQAGRLVRAAFDVKFAAARRPRAVVVRPTNVAQFARDGDAAAVERWLAARGFLRGVTTDGRG